MTPDNWTVLVRVLLLVGIAVTVGFSYANNALLREIRRRLP